MGKKAIILGGSGFLGSALAAEAQKLGWDTTTVNRAGYAGCIGAVCDLLINANGNSKKYLPERDPGLDFDLSVGSVAHSLHDIKASLYVYISSVEVYADKGNPDLNDENAPVRTSRINCYGFHKHLAEQMVKRHAQSWLIFRMGGFVGPGLKKNPIHDLLTGKPLRVHPDSRFQFIDSRHMAEIVFRVIALGARDDIFNLTGGGNIGMREIAALLPGNPLAGAPVNVPPELYDINIRKIQTYCAVPASRDEVVAFVQDVLAGKMRLS